MTPATFGGGYIIFVTDNTVNGFRVDRRAERAYRRAATPAEGVIVPLTGNTIRLVSTSAQGGFIQMHVGPAK